MKKLIILFILLFLSLPASLRAQENDTITAVITYAFSHLRDTTKGTKPYMENMDLFLSRNSSWYKSADKDSIHALVIDNFVASGRKVMVPIPSIEEELFLDFANHTFLIRDRFLGIYLMEDDWPVINWEITNETSTISSLNCQKAIGEWRGRTYTAWFSSELPYHAGPWKLNGLPGLIIEAYDTNKEVVFKFAGFHTIKDGTEIIQVPTEGIKTTVREYQEMKDAYYQDIAGSINATLGRTAIISTPGSKSAPKRGIQNPLELTAN